MSYSGSGAIWALKAGDFVSQTFAGTQAGYDAAVAYCGSNGFVWVGPGLSAISIGTVSAGVTVCVYEGGAVKVYGGSTNYGRTGTTSGIIDGALYANLQTALDAVPPGGTLQLPAGTFTPSTTPAFTGLVRDTSTQGGCTIRGSGHIGTGLYLNTGNNTDLIKIRGGGVTLENLALRGPAVSGTGRGVAFLDQNAAAGTINVAQTTMRRVNIYDTASWGIEYDNSNGGFIWDVDLHEVIVYAAASGGSLHIGAQGQSTVGVNCIGCEFNGPAFSTYGNGPMDRGAVHLDNVVRAGFYGCFFQPVTFSTMISLWKGKIIEFRNCHFETSGTSDGGGYCITTSGYTGPVVFDTVSLYRPDETVGPRILKTDVTTSAVTITMRDWAISYDTPSSNTDDIVLGAAADVLLMENVSQGPRSGGSARQTAITDRVGVGFAPSGGPAWMFKIPGVTTTSAVTTPVDGTMIWDSTAHKLKLYENGAWKTVTTT